MNCLAPNTISAIRTYIDNGVDLKDTDLSPANRERVRVAEAVYERLQQDPMLDVMQCLRHVYGRSYEQAHKDIEVVELFVEAMDDVPRRLLAYRARKTAEKLVRIGEQIGDPKWIDRGLNQLIKIDRLDEEEVQQEDVRNTASLPPVIVGIEVVNPDRQSIDDESFKKLIAKYGGKEDDFSKLIAVRARRMQGEDINTIALEQTDDDE